MYNLIDAKTKVIITRNVKDDEIRVAMKSILMNGYNSLKGNSDDLCGNVIHVKDNKTNKIVYSYLFVRPHKNVSFVNAKSYLRRLKNKFLSRDRLESYSMFPAQCRLIVELEKLLNV